jgi:hypothetical protein
MDNMHPDVRLAREYAAHATEFAFPVYRTVNGQQELHDVITVSSMAQVPDGRWQVVHGPFFCMAGNTDDWIAFVNSGVEEEEAQFDEDCTFTSLDRAIKAAVAEQRQTQDDLDNLPASKGGPT